MNDLSKLVHHCIWANKSWIDFLMIKTPDDLQLRKLKSHILLGEQIWFQRIFEKKLNRKIWQTLSFDLMKNLHQKNSKRYRKLLEEDLNRTVTFQRFSGERLELSVRDIIIHLCTHGFHHRGQMSDHVSSIGLIPINTYYIEYSNEG